MKFLLKTAKKADSVKTAEPIHFEQNKCLKQYTLEEGGHP